MSKTQDVFGSSPKSVLNKPLMQVQDRKASGTAGGASVSGQNNRTLNTVIIDEIAGASLSANQVNLPAGIYYAEAWAAGRKDGSSGEQKSRLSIKTAADVTLARGSQVACQQSGEDMGGVTFGQFTLAVPTSIKVAQRFTAARAVDGLGVAVSSGEQEMYCDLRIWKLDSNIETPILSDPSLTLVRPLMHMQDQKTKNTAGGTSSTGDNTRTLNTVLVNEIAGASLSSNTVTLPAGTYYMEAVSPSAYSVSFITRTIIEVDGTPTLLGTTQYTNNNISGKATSASGRITLASSADITVVTYCSTGLVTNGLGYPTNQDPYEVYTDLQIWQLDAVIKTPVIVNDKLFPLPGNVIVTGNMHGLEYSRTSPSTITVQAGICMDSTNENVLTLVNPQLVTIPSAVTTNYNLFLCDDGVVRTDTDVDGANIPVQYKRRWIGLVITDGSGAVRNFFFLDPNTMEFTGAGGVTVHTGAVSNSGQTLNYSGSIAGWPTKRITSVALWGRSTGSNTLVVTAKPDGSTAEYCLMSVTQGSYTQSGQSTMVMILPGMTIVCLDSDRDVGDIGVKRLRFKR